MHKVKILMTEFVTHDVKRFIVEKPQGYKFEPGQATDVAINKPGWEDKIHSFTFTSLNDDLVLEFTIKGYPTKLYPTHKGVTELLHTLVPGDEILIDEPWGTIHFKNKGVFLAAGAGITPFIAILRSLRKTNQTKGNTLIFSNKTAKDVVLGKELTESVEKALFTLSREQRPDFINGRLTKELLQKEITDFKQHFYICGPKPFVADMKTILGELGASTDALVFEE